MTITCPVCSAPNDEWRPFCTRCSQSLEHVRTPGGTVVGAPARSAPPAPVPPAPAPPAPGPSGSARPEHNEPAPWLPLGTRTPPPPPTAPPPGPGLRRAAPGDALPVPAPTRMPREFRRPRVWRAAVIVPVVVVLAVAGGIAVIAARRGNDFPKRWDPRIAPLAHFVEGARGLRFKHPVAVDFVPDAKFRTLVTHQHAPTATERLDAQREVGTLRALGLAEGDIDLMATHDRLDGETVLAFYSDRGALRHRVEVRGTALDVATRVTVVHELTHALQDQWFDLEALQLYGELHHDDAVVALYEGDAVDVQHRYADSLSKADKAAYAQQDESVQRGIDVSTIPDALVIDQQWPYDLGPQLVSVLRASGGHRLDAAFRRPPRDEAQVVDPLRFVRNVRPVSVVAAAPKDGTDVRHLGEVGMVGWYLILTEHGDVHASLRALDGWAGDALTTFERAGRTCIAAEWVAKTPAAAGAVAQLLAGWRTAMAPARARVDQAGTHVAITSCDPGPSARLDAHREKLAYGLLSARGEVLGELVRDHAVVSRAWCAANGVADRIPQSALTGTGTGYFASQAFGDDIRAAVHSC